MAEVLFSMETTECKIPFSKHRAKLPCLFAVVLLSSFLILGCSQKQPPEAPLVLDSRAVTPDIRSAREEDPPAATHALKQAPITVQVAQAFFDEDELKIKIHLEAKTQMDPAQILVAVQGLREGEIVEEHLQLVGDITKTKTLEPGKRIALVFSLRGEALTEYQVRCSWGTEAAEIAAKRMELPTQVASATTEEADTMFPQPHPPDEPEAGKKEEEVTSVVSLEEVDIEKQASACPSPPCDILHTVHAIIANNSGSTVESIELAIGLYWANEGQLPAIPSRGSPPTPNEEVIRLEDLGLAPGDTKRVRIKVDRSVPVIPGGGFVPHLRIVQYNAPGASS